MTEKLITLRLDTSTGELIINGCETKDVDYMQLIFDNGSWGLHIRQHQYYGQRERSA